MINRFKYANCNNPECGCGGIDVAGHKVGKIFYCYPSYQKMKSNEQFAKQLKKQQQRNNLKSNNGKIRALDNKLLDGVERDSFEKMQQFWKYCRSEIAKHPYCAECNSFISEYGYKMTDSGKKISVDLYRAASAHCLPKRKEYGFPSIAHLEDNFLGALGSGCGCHFRYDKSWEDAAKMKIFPIAIEKVKKLYPFIDKSELKNLHEVFRQ